MGGKKEEVEGNVLPNAQSGGLRSLNEVLSNQQVSCYITVHTHTRCAGFFFFLLRYKIQGSSYIYNSPRWKSI